VFITLTSGVLVSASDYLVSLLVIRAETLALIVGLKPAAIKMNMPPNKYIARGQTIDPRCIMLSIPTPILLQAQILFIFVKHN
jgi:hypothetical protein